MPFRAAKGEKVNTSTKNGLTTSQIKRRRNWASYQSAREWDDVRTYERITVKSATLIYSFFRNLVLNSPAEAERYRSLLDRNSDRKYLVVRRN